MYRAVSISPDVSAYFMILRKRETERERNRVGGSIGSSEQLWPFPAQSQLSTTIPTLWFSRHFYKPESGKNSTLRTVVPLTLFANIQVRYGYCLMQQKCTQMQTWDLSNILHNQIFGPKKLHIKNALIKFSSLANRRAFCRYDTRNPIWRNFAMCDRH